MVRIQKYIADCGICTRRQAEDLVAKGRVSINATPAAFGDVVDPESDEVMVDGRLVRPPERVYLILNKPRGLLSTLSTTDDTPTIARCLKGVGARVYPVGHLPRDAEGLLLLTNDGDLAHALHENPHQVERTYVASVEGLVTPERLRRLSSDGIEVGVARPVRARAVLLHSGMRTSVVRLTVYEGQGVSVNRILDAMGHAPFEIRLVGLGNLHIGRLRPGEWRHLAPREVNRLRKRLSAAWVEGFSDG